MLQWRWKLRRAEQALSDGRFDEACRLLSDSQLLEFLPAKRLADRVAAKLAERAGQRIGAGRSAAAFLDLAVADKIGDGDAHSAAVRVDYAERSVAEAMARLTAGGDTAAAEIVSRAARRHVDNAALRLLGEVAEMCHSAQRSANNGDLPAAEASLKKAAGLVASGADLLTRGGSHERPANALAKALERRVQAMSLRGSEHAAATQRMRNALADESWSDALAAVEIALRHAPNDPRAIALRRRAWKKLGLEATRRYDAKRRPPAETHRNQPPAAASSNRGRDAAQAAARQLRRSTNVPSAEDNKVSGPASSNEPSNEPIKEPAIGSAPNRRMLWIDGVGGLLVCLDDEVVLGQPAGDPRRGPAVPILADLSRRHAVLRREAGRYVLDPLGPVCVDGKPARETTVLPDKCVLELGAVGSGVRLLFEKPHALSATARLTPRSGHRFSPPADAVLLMADSCVMGPASHSHVPCRDWEADVVLYRHAGDLRCRAAGPVTRNGAETPAPVSLLGNPRIEGQDFAFTVENPDEEAPD